MNKRDKAIADFVVAFAQIPSVQSEPGPQASLEMFTYMTKLNTCMNDLYDAGYEEGHETAVKKLMEP